MDLERNTDHSDLDEGNVGLQKIPRHVYLQVFIFVLESVESDLKEAFIYLVLSL